MNATWSDAATRAMIHPLTTGSSLIASTGAVRSKTAIVTMIIPPAHQ
jgi:hypothetical protein